jgi:hypothetical protein
LRRGGALTLPIALPHHGLTIADVDGDGYPDLLVGTTGGGVFDIYWGDDTASYANRPS